jgi:hypothetical protein
MLFAAVHVLLMTDAVEKSVTNGESSKSFFNNIRPEGHIAAPQQANPSLLIDHFSFRYHRSGAPHLTYPSACPLDRPRSSNPEPRISLVVLVV